MPIKCANVDSILFELKLKLQSTMILLSDE